MACAATLAVASPAARAASFEEAVRLHQAGRAREALAAYREVAVHTADALERAAALNNACVVEGDLGEHREALADCERALALRRTLRDEPGIAETANNLALALSALGRGAEAGERFAEALAIDRRRGDHEAIVVDLGNLAALAVDAGRYGDAMARYGEAEAMARAAAGAPWAAAQLRAMRIGKGVVLEKVGAFHEAVRLYRDLLAEPEADAAQRASLLVNAGVIYRNLGDPVSAIARFDEAIALLRRSGDRSALSNALLNRALALHLNLARPRAAEADYRAALALSQAAGDRTEEVQDLFYLARLLREQRRLDEAEQLLRRCLEVAQAAHLPEGIWSAREGLGRIAAARGDLHGALAALEGALQEIDRVRGALPRPGWRAGYFGDKRAAFAATVALLCRLDALEPRRGWDARAFAVAQRAKARDLLDALGARGGSLAPRTAPEVQVRLGRGVLIEYLAGEGHLYRFVLDRDHLALQDLGDDGPPMAAARRVRNALAHGRAPVAGDLAALAATLPAGDALERDDELRIAADGAMREVPFELLTARGARAPLVASSTISYLPSGSVLASMAPPAPASGRLRLAGLATPELPAAARELARVATLLGGRHTLFGGADATEANARAALSARPDVLHVAAHAMIAGAAGTAIHLRPAGRDDGLWTPAEVASSRRGGARLVVLAACSTALATSSGDESGAGDDDGRALSSLTGSFLAAGARSVVATLWDVDDAATAVFMEQLYAGLGRGMTSAAALRAAKERLRADPRWDRPALWAAYVLVGDDVAVAPRSRLPLLTAVLALLAVLVWLLAAALSGSSGRRSRS